MTGARLELGNPESYATAREYIESHLAPAVTELHRITNELLVPGTSSAEEWGVDMVSETAGVLWKRLDRRLDETAKHVVFDGSEYFTLPKDLLKSKQVKVQLVAVVYAYSADRLAPVQFRLVRDDGAIIENSVIETDSVAPVTITRTLPFQAGDHCIQPARHTYFIEGRSVQNGVFAVCRRFSLSFIYI